MTALGEPIDRRIERNARRGITLVPDTRGVFHRLSVADNLRLARWPGGRDIDTIYDYFPKLKTMRSRRCGNLSGGEQQMLALAKALLTGPQILLIDEMSLGLSPVAVQDLLPRLRAIADDANMAVVLVEQHIELALGIADSAMVLHHGRVALSAPAADSAATASVWRPRTSVGTSRFPAPRRAADTRHVGTTLPIDQRTQEGDRCPRRSHPAATGSPDAALATAAPATGRPTTNCSTPRLR